MLHDRGTMYVMLDGEIISVIDDWEMEVEENTCVVRNKHDYSKDVQCGNRVDRGQK